MTGDLSDTVPSPITQIDSPDQEAQYRNALSLIEKLISPTSPEASTKASKAPPNPVDVKQGAALIPNPPVVAEWLLVSVWRQAILRTSDDRRPNSSSQIMTDLKIWDEWMKKKHYQIEREMTRNKRPDIHAHEKIGMISIPLIEGSGDSKGFQLVENEARSNDWDPALIKLKPDRYDNFQRVVDSVSSDMAASHLLWIYQRGVPVYQTIHHTQTGGDALSLTSKVDGLLNLELT